MSKYIYVLYLMCCFIYYNC